MAEDEGKAKTRGRLDTSSKLWRTAFVVLAILLVFSGSYIVLVLNRVLDLDYGISLVSGVAIFIIGLVFLWYLIRKHVIS